LIDSRHGFKANDLEMVQFLHENNIPYAIVATKRDKLSGNEWTKQKKKIEKQLAIKSLRILSFSSVNKTGREDILLLIENFLEK
jgi:GTP-binding protein